MPPPNADTAPGEPIIAHLLHHPGIAHRFKHIVHHRHLPHIMAGVTIALACTLHGTDLAVAITDIAGADKLVTVDL